MANQLKMGVILSYINIFLSMGIALFYTPIMIRLLGQSEYGLYSLIGALAGYLTILDMGLGNTIVRYIAQNRVTGDRNSEKDLNGAFFLLYLAIGLFTALIGSFLYFNIDTIFAHNLQAEEINKAKYMLLILIINFSISFPLSIFSSIMQAYEKFISLRVVNILRALLTPLMILPFLYMGYGSVMMVIVTTIMNLSCLSYSTYYCYRYLNTKICIKNIKTVPIKEMLIYSFFIFLNAVVDKIYWSSGQTILGIVVDTKTVAVYAIAMQFAMMYMTFSSAISGVLLPKVTKMVAEGVNNKVLSELMIKVGRLQFFIVGVLFATFVSCGREFLYLWAGEAYIEAYPMILIIMISLMTPLVQNTGISILQAKNLNRYRMIIYSIFAFINIAISIPLASLYGGIGCAISTGISLILSAGIAINYYYYHIGLDVRLFWENIFKISGPMIFILVLGPVCNLFFNIWEWETLAFKVGFIFSTYILISYFFTMNKYEKTLMLSTFKGIRKG